MFRYANEIFYAWVLLMAWAIVQIAPVYFVYDFGISLPQDKVHQDRLWFRIAAQSFLGSMLYAAASNKIFPLLLPSTQKEKDSQIRFSKLSRFDAFLNLRIALFSLIFMYFTAFTFISSGFVYAFGDQKPLSVFYISMAAIFNGMGLYSFMDFWKVSVPGSELDFSDTYFEWPVKFLRIGIFILFTQLIWRRAALIMRP